MTPGHRLVLATRNPGKARELIELLQSLGVEMASLSLFPALVLPDESATSYAENALAKARAVAAATGEAALADDSGIEIDRLGGRPGIRSARYVGDGATDLENNLKVLKELEGVPAHERGATFVCVLGVVTPDGRELIARGECRGAVGFEMKGDKGFGYDPLFICHEGKTLAELPPEIKNRVSHRGRAAAKLKELLLVFLSGDPSIHP